MSVGSLISLICARSKYGPLFQHSYGTVTYKENIDLWG